MSKAKKAKEEYENLLQQAGVIECDNCRSWVHLTNAAVKFHEKRCDFSAVEVVESQEQ
jgi:hypothetical protein